MSATEVLVDAGISAIEMTLTTPGAIRAVEDMTQRLPTEFATAASSGAALSKLFPASASGSGYGRSLLDPLPDLRIMPTGRIGPADVGTWLRAGAVTVGLGSSLTGDVADDAAFVVGHFFASPPSDEASGGVRRLTRQIAHTDDLGPAAEHGASWFCTSKMPGEPVRLRPSRAERSTNEGG